MTGASIVKKRDHKSKGNGREEKRENSQFTLEQQRHANHSQPERGV